MQFRRALEEIFDVPRNSLRDADTRDSVQTWTSIADVQIMTLVATELKIEPDAQLVEAETVGDLIRVLEAKGVLSAAPF
jgi:acyl carrier protein